MVGAFHLNSKYTTIILIAKLFLKNVYQLLKHAWCDN